MPPPGSSLPGGMINWPDFVDPNAPGVTPDVPYIQTTPPEQYSDARWWLDDELQRIRSDLASLRGEPSGLVLLGGADPVPFNTGINYIVNYSDRAAFKGGQLTYANAVTGELQAQSTGVYRISAVVTGDQGNNAFNEDMFLMLDYNGQQMAAARETVPNNKTTGRIFVTFLTRRLMAGDIVRLATTATADMGTFTILGISFELERID